MVTLDKKLEKFRDGGLTRMHVVADFDGTLIYKRSGGKEVPSVVSVLRNGDYISPDYAAAANALAAKYKPMETDMSLSVEMRKKAMSQWWREHFELMIGSGLNRRHLEAIVGSAGIKFRDGVLEFLDYLHEHSVPVVIISSSGLGDTIPMLLMREGRMYDNVHVVTNRFEWGEDGRALSIRKPIIHSMNKDEADIPSEVKKAVRGRGNVLLVGDSLDDPDMVKGSHYDALISFGFLNSGNEKNKAFYNERFDFIIENDGNFDEINKFVRGLR